MLFYQDSNVLAEVQEDTRHNTWNIGEAEA